MENTVYKRRQKIINIGLGILALVVLTGSVFKIMHWPFPQLLFTGSYVGGFVVLLISYSLQRNRIKELEKQKADENK